MSAERTVHVLREGFPERAERDTAVSHAVLRRVSDGVLPSTLRLHRPGAVLAFGPKDRLAPGFGQAVEAARAMGFGAVHRLAGGRAAVFHQETLAFSWAIPDPSPRTGIRARFEEVSALLCSAFRDLGVDARVGEVPGEYCPGEFSVNARGKAKLMGVGQRLVQHAAHVGGVVVVGGSERVREVLLPVNRALELGWDPTTAGSLEEEVPGLEWEEAATVILARFSGRYRLVDARLDGASLALAGELEPRHRV